MIRRFLIDYFCFSRSERNGTIALAAIMVLVFAFPYVYEIFRTPREYPADPEFMSRIEAFYGLRDDTIHREFHPAQVPDGPVREGSLDSAGSWKDEAGIQDDIRIEINTTDDVGLMRVKGIGPVLSQRILKYRDLLGGFREVPQLQEVYGIDLERYLEIEPYLYADTTLLLKLRPGTDEFSTLLRHPYLNFEQVSQIFRLRARDSLHSLQGLLQSPAFTIRDVTRLAPYLMFE
jgi:hypothetical protein